jgi:hypothetical protein
MVVKKKTAKKTNKTAKKTVKKKEEEDEGMSLDDAFADDDDVDYAESKSAKVKKPVKEPRAASSGGGDDNIKIKASKPIGDLKKGDKLKVDGLELEIDAHVEMMDHGSTKEMAIECFDPKKDKDYQIRYFSDQVETSMEVFELVEIMYSRMNVKQVEW